MPLKPGRRTHYDVSVPGTYTVTIRKVAHPILTIDFDVPSSADPAHLRSLVIVERTRDSWRIYVRSWNRGPRDRMAIGHFEDQDVQLDGNQLWVATWHPDLGYQFRTGSIDASTLYHRVVVGRGNLGVALEARLRDADGRPMPGVEMELRDTLQLVPMRVVTTGPYGSFRADGIADLPKDWIRDLGEMLEGCLLMHNRRTSNVRFIGTSLQSGSMPTFATLRPGAFHELRAEM